MDTGAAQANERIAALETRVEGQAGDIQEIKADVKAILAALNMGRGAWKAVLLIGSAIVTGIGGVAWLADKLHFWRQS